MTPRSSPTVSPQESSSSHGGKLGNGDEAQNDGKTNQHVDRNEKSCLPIEESEEAIGLKLMPSPSPPSRQEMLEHNINHMHVRTGCPQCVAGKAKADKHSASGGLAGSETPVVSMDYAFMGDKNASGNEEVEEEGRSSDKNYEN